MTFHSNYQFTLEGTLTTAASTVSISADLEQGSVVEFTNAEIVFRNRTASIIERAVGSASAWTLTLSKRWLEQWSTETENSSLKKERKEWTVCYVTILAPSLVDRQGDNTFTGTNTFKTVDFNDTSVPGLKPLSVTTAQRTSLSLGASDTALVYDSDLGEYYAWQWWAWSALSSWSTQANASTTVAGKVEESTTAQHTAGTSTWETGARLFSTPWTIQASIQSGEALYAGASAEWSDSYVVTMTPTLTAYTTGMTIVFQADVANTGACTINVDWLGVKNIKLLNWDDPISWSIAANQLAVLQYDGTNFVIQNPQNINYETVTIGEAVAAWDWLTIGDVWQDETITQSTEDSDTALFLNTTSWFSRWQSFLPTYNSELTSIKVYLSSFWSPTWDISIDVYSDTWSTLLWSSTNVIDATTLSAGATEYEFLFDWIELTASTTYYFSFAKTWSVNASNYVEADYKNSGNPYAWWSLYNITQAWAWTEETGDDLKFVIDLVAWHDDKANKITSSYTSGAILYALESWSADESIAVWVWIISWLSWLQAWSLYYPSSTGGELTNTANSNTVAVGRAISATTMVTLNW